MQRFWLIQMINFFIIPPDKYGDNSKNIYFKKMFLFSAQIS